MNEAETKAKLVEPKLKASGWNEEKISREFYYNKDYIYTEGRIILIGSEVKRGRKKRIDYLLRYTDGFPIAVVEVKPATEKPESALEQAKEYARDLGLAFAYSTNGYKIIEYDFFTNTSTLLDNFPTPQELWQRWKINTGLSEPIESNLVQVGRVYGYTQSSINPLTYPYYIQEGKEPRYYQERAIKEIIVSILKGKRRILLTMATGTGKTFVAFQVVWKLLKSGHFLKIGRPGRVLFLADRIFLRNQAYNAFSPFSNKDGEPRYLIEKHPTNLNRQIYFGIYQTLWTEDDKGERLYQKFPKDFFDLVIIDECHRSGWGTWREILDYFESAIHLGMTATPKRKDNMDTYAYFGEPVYEYSLSQGIEDGFLATYRVHRVLTTIDKEGLILEDAIEQGAEVFIPEDIEPRSIYTTSQFEREITLPDRTKEIVKHLANLLRKYGPMEKTIVFCVDMEHARQVARLLQDELGSELNIDDYAVPIISEEKEMAQKWLEDFVSSDSPKPVIAVTAELLSTGIDVPPCKNIVFMKTVSSPVLFKQIIGRGSRIDKTTEKYFFRIIDYTNATRLFDKWDILQEEEKVIPTATGPLTAGIKGKVFHAFKYEVIQGAKVSVRTGTNIQQGPILTDKDGFFEFKHLPEGELLLIVSAPGFYKRKLSVETIANNTIEVEVLMKPQVKRRKKIRVEGIEVEIAEEKIFIIEPTGQSLTLEQYKAYIAGKVRQKAGNKKELRDIWIDNSKRNEFLQFLRSVGADSIALIEVEELNSVDTFDLLAYLSYGTSLKTREDRYRAFMNRESKFMSSFKKEEREVIEEMLDRYRAWGIEEMTSEKLFDLSPFKEWGRMLGIGKRFGGIERFKDIVKSVIEKIYPLEEAL